ncbi:MAG: methylenetetrahydrofolate reductase [Pseudomonadota bacterium]
MTMPTISCEFYPPRDSASRARLIDNVANKLNDTIQPQFFSVTYGAGGSTKDGTRQTVRCLQESGATAVPHLSMGQDDAQDILHMLAEYAKAGITQIVTLRGDQPSGMAARHFHNNAETLVRLIREHTGDRFHLTVAAYPEVHPDSHSAQEDLDFFQRKVEAGANSAITQYFYNPDAYAYFLDHCAKRKIDIPIYPGIMPITNIESLERFSAKAGAEIPRWLLNNLIDQPDETALLDYGVEVVVRLCERLISLGAPGLHFYTLNRWGATVRIARALH